MRFEFATVTRIIFGAGTLREIATLAPKIGKRAFVVTGSKPERAAPLLNLLQEHKIEYATYSTAGEPNLETVRSGRDQAQQARCDFVIAFGGGSALDAGKAIAALMTNPGDPLDYLEVIGRGEPIRNASAPLITIPTTAGTGSEVTSNAVIFSPEHHVKVSLRSPLMLAEVALVDSTLTYTSPPGVTAQSGLDALTQVIEPFTSNKANPLTDAICRDGIRRAARSLQRAFERGDDAEAREDMSLVALFGGMALANAKLGAVHGFAGPIGGMFDAPHGGLCARLLPYVMQMNVRALRSRQPDSDVLRRYDEIAQLMTGDADAGADDGILWLYELCDALQIPPLSSYGLAEADYSAIIEKAAVASSMQGNPIKLTPEEMHEILAQAE